ncbi:kinectin, putative, partial [Entamoeba invadens IP1]
MIVTRIYKTLCQEVHNQMWFLISFSVMVVCGGTAVFYSHLTDIFIFEIWLYITWPWMCCCMVSLNASDPGRISSRAAYFSRHCSEKLKMIDIHLFGNNITAKYKKCYLQRPFCASCKFVRPLRVHHCRRSNCCVDRFDHWCSWVGNTIGSYNRKTFFVFLTITFFTDIVAALVCGIAVYKMFLKMLFGIVLKCPLLVLSFCIFSIVSFFICKLWAFHVKAMLHNYTTYEYIKNKDVNLPNPFVTIYVLFIYYQFIILPDSNDRDMTKECGQTSKNSFSFPTALVYIVNYRFFSLFSY